VLIYLLLYQIFPQPQSTQQPVAQQPASE